MEEVFGNTDSKLAKADLERLEVIHRRLGLFMDGPGLDGKDPEIGRGEEHDRESDEKV